MNKKKPSGKNSFVAGENNEASGDNSFAHGIETRATTIGSHTEGFKTVVKDEPEYGKHAKYGHAEGRCNRSTGWEAHAEGACCWAEGLISHAQNCITLAAGNDSHTEGVQTVTGRRRYFIKEKDQGMENLKGFGEKPYFIVRYDDVNPVGDYTGEFVDTTIKIIQVGKDGKPYEMAPTWWRHNTIILFSNQETECRKFTVLKSIYDKKKKYTKVFFDNDNVPFPAPYHIMMACASYAPEGGKSTYSDGKGQHAEGKRTNAAGNFAHSEGMDTTCFGRFSHAEGYRSKTTGMASHAEGEGVVALADHSHAEGYCTKAKNIGSHIMGRYGETDTDYAWHLAAGDEKGPQIKARIDATGAYHAGHWSAGGNGFAEVFQWEDGNPDDENRTGLFVTLKNDKIVKADDDDDYILGVVTETSAFISGTCELDRNREKNNRIWAAINLIGKVYVKDNGACELNSYCRPGKNGIAIPATSGYRILKRTGKDIIQILFR